MQIVLLIIVILLTKLTLHFEHALFVQHIYQNAQNVLIVHFVFYVIIQVII